MKKRLPVFMLIGMLAVVSGFAQTEILIDDFTGTIDPIRIYGDDYDASGAPNQSIVTFDNNMLKASYVFNKPDWFPRTVWYQFEDYVDVSDVPNLEVKFMVEDNDNDTIKVRLDLYGDGAEPYNDTIRQVMETNARPWELRAANGEWYTVSSNFTTENRWACSYWVGGIPETRVDSTRINGFEAFTSYGDNNLANMAGTLWIDWIKFKDWATGTEKLVYGRETAFSIAIYPLPAVDYLNLRSENMMSDIRLVDITGRMIRSVERVGATQARLNVSGLPGGIYFLNVTDEKGNLVTKKFLIK